MNLPRRAFLGGAAALTAVSRLARADAAGPHDIVARARALAARPYVRSEADLPPPFDALTYDSHRAIRPRPGGAGGIALGGGIEAHLLPPGWLFNRPVEIVLPGDAEPVPFSADLFTYDPRYFAAPPAPDPAHRAAGFSGIRFNGPLNRADAMDEILVFQGASYFRALARDTVYGLSARALALGTGGAAPEEFPDIVRIEVTGARDGRLDLAALVDSPRAAAAFLARIEPGARTTMTCELVLFPREDIADAGIAPLTSMFFFGPMGPAFADDFRPSVHDSAVLWMRNGAGETLWRPLANPAAVQVSAFADTGPRAFGLIQAPRDFAAFQDEEGAYHRRPDAWVEPLGEWGHGAVHLLEIPTEDEYADNIVAFWRPAEPLEAGREHRFAYRLTWSGTPPESRYPLTPSRSASGLEPVDRRGRLYVIDFAGDAPAPESLDLEVSVQGDAGRISGATLYPLAGTALLRASFVFEPVSGSDAAEIRIALRRRDGTLAAPIWLHRWTPARSGLP